METLTYIDEETFFEYEIKYELHTFDCERDCYDYASGNVYQEKTGDLMTICNATLPNVTKDIEQDLKDFVEEEIKADEYNYKFESNIHPIFENIFSDWDKIYKNKI